jgi:hypothetical protein
MDSRPSSSAAMPKYFANRLRENCACLKIVMPKVTTTVLHNRFRPAAFDRRDRKRETTRKMGWAAAFALQEENDEHYR